jgi:hypothetical protein
VLHIGEEATRAQDVRDVLRVCTRYGMGEVTAPPFPAWLAVSGDPDALGAKLVQAQTLVRKCFADGSSSAEAR